MSNGFVGVDDDGKLFSITETVVASVCGCQAQDRPRSGSGLRQRGLGSTLPRNLPRNLPT